MTAETGAGRAVPVGSRRLRGGIVGARRRTTVLATAPAVALILFATAVPAVQGLRIAFSDWQGFGPIDFVGIGNFVDAFTTTTFVPAMGLTAFYAIGCAVLIVALATVLAAAVSGGVRGAAFYRVVWFLPGIAPIAAAGVFWSIAFQPGEGAVNAVLGAIGLGDDHAWLASSTLSIYPTIFVTVWASTGFAFLLLLGAVEQIPVSIYEAARVDGASAVRSFFSITLPLIRPVLATTAVLELIFQFNGFTVIWAMTEGGPGYATSILPVLVYREAFQQLHYGLASAMAVMGGVVLIAVALIGLRFTRSTQQER